MLNNFTIRGFHDLHGSIKGATTKLSEQLNSSTVNSLYLKH